MTRNYIFTIVEDKFSFNHFSPSLWGVERDEKKQQKKRSIKNANIDSNNWNCF